MLSIKLFKEKSFLEKLTITIRNIPEDKMFYIGLSSISLMILISIFVIKSFNSSYGLYMPKRGTDLYMISEENIRFLNPLYAKNNLEKFTSSLLYSSLVKLEGDKYINDLAESVQIDANGQIVNVKLKDDVYFADGSPINAEDVIFTFEMAGNITIDYESRVKYEGIKSEIIDNKNFKLLLKKSYSNIYDLLTIGILKKQDYADINLDNVFQSEKSFFTTESGLYKIEDVGRNQDNNISNLLLTKNKFSNITTNHKSIIIKPEMSAEASLNELKNSDNNNLVLFDVNKIEYEELKSVGYKKNDYTLPRISGIYLNPNKNEIFSKKENRKYIYQAIDRNRLVADYLNNYATTTYGLLPSSKNIEYEIPVYNNISSSSTISLIVLNTRSQIDIGEFVKSELAQIGLSIEVRPVENIDIVNNHIKNRDFEMLLYNVEIDSPLTLYAFWHSSQRNAPGYNFTSYASKDFDSNLDLIRNSTQNEVVNEALGNLKKEFYNEFPYIPLYTQIKSIYNKSDTHIDIPPNINNYKELSQNIQNWHTEREIIYNFLTKYQDLSDKIYKSLH